MPPLRPADALHRLAGQAGLGVQGGVRVRDSEGRRETMNDRNKGFLVLVLVPVLALLVAIIAMMLLGANADSSIHPMATWTPRPTGLPTHEAFLPFVECERPATATPIPRPTIGVSDDQD